MSRVEHVERVETLAEIVAEIRKDKTPYSAKVVKKLEKQTVGDLVLMQDAAQCLRDDEHYIKSLADRIEAAAKREKAEIEASALSVGGVVEAARYKPAASTSSAPTVGNSAAMREALKESSIYARSLLWAQMPHGEGGAK